MKALLQILTLALPIFCLMDSKVAHSQDDLLIDCRIAHKTVVDSPSVPVKVEKKITISNCVILKEKATDSLFCGVILETDYDPYINNVYTDTNSLETSNSNSRLITPIRKPQKGEALTIYPNPCRTKLMLSLPYKSERLDVISMNGRLVLSRRTIGSKNLELDLSSLIPGNYLVKSVGTDGIQTQRLVIN